MKDHERNTDRMNGKSSMYSLFLTLFPHLFTDSIIQKDEVQKSTLITCWTFPSHSVYAFSENNK